MKFYLAGAYSRRDQLRAFRAELVRRGHQVTSRWLDESWPVAADGESSAAPPEHRARVAQANLDDVLAADGVVSFTEEPASGIGRRGGRHVEFGIGLGAGKGLVIIGPRENVFHHLDRVEVYADEAAFLDVLDRLSN